MRTKFDIQNENQMLRAKIKKKSIKKRIQNKTKKATNRMMIKSNIKIK